MYVLDIQISALFPERSIQLIPVRREQSDASSRLATLSDSFVARAIVPSQRSPPNQSADHDIIFVSLAREVFFIRRDISGSSTASYMLSPPTSKLPWSEANGSW